MSLRDLLISFSVILILGSTISGQSNPHIKKLISKTFYVNSILAVTSDCKIKITPDDIVPGKEECAFYELLEIGEKITLQGFTRKGDWAKLQFTTETKPESFEIYVKNDSEKTFKESFDLFFSSRGIEYQRLDCDVETKSEVLDKIGFPSRLVRKNGKEYWHFHLDYINQPFCSGFDFFIIEIEKNKVINIGGSI